MIRSRKFFFASASAGALLVGAVGVYLPLQSAGAGGAATINVDTTDDENNTDGDCSLREAVESANTNSAVDDCEAGLGSDTVMIPAGTYTFALDGDGDIDVTSNIAFVGAGASTTIVDANGVDRVFDVGTDGDVTVSFEGLTVQGGDVRGEGGGIDAESADVTIRNSIVTDNAATGDGGGIGLDNSDSTLRIEDSVVSNNTSGDDGGGIEVDNDSTLTIVDSTLSGNTAASEGGAIHIDDATATSITGSTLSNNTANIDPQADEESFDGFRPTGGGSACDGGGGAFNQDEFPGEDRATTTIVNSTISGNTAPICEGGGIYVVSDLTLTHVTLFDNGAATGGNLFNRFDGSSTTVENTLIGAPRTGGDCVLDGDTLTSSGGNIDSDGSCGLDDASDQTVADAQLGPLADNGGTTDTHLPQAGSAAIDAALEANCVDDDQRDVARPQDGDGDGTSACDVGAVEVVFTPEPTTTEAPTTTEGDVGANTATPATPTVARPTFTG